MKKFYQAPTLDVFESAVEQGFLVSLPDQLEKPNVDPEQGWN